MVPRYQQAVATRKTYHLKDFDQSLAKVLDFFIIAKSQMTQL